MEARNFNQRFYWYTAALAALLWDWAISLEDEVRYIWKSPSITNKWVYLISRYLGIVSQFVASFITFSNGFKDVPKEICQRWTCLETTISLVLFGLVEFIQFLRVYAFYDKNTKIGIFLASWFCIELGTAGYYQYRASGLDFDPSCGVIRMPWIAIVVAVNMLVSQFATLFVLFWRRKVVAPGSLEDVPVAYIVLRDGTLLFLATCVNMGISTIYSAKGGHIVFMTQTLNATLSIAACRMALNLQSIRPNLRRTTLTYDVHLTTLPFSTGVLPTITVTALPHSSCPMDIP